VPEDRAAGLDREGTSASSKAEVSPSSTAHEHQANPDEYLSIEYLHYHAVARTPGKNPAAGTSMAAAAAALAEEGQPLETAWPYSAIQVDPWVPPAITSTIHKTTLPGKLGFDDIVAELDQGRSMILGLVITDAFFRPDVKGRVADHRPDIELGGHAVLAVGHGRGHDGTNLMLIRNSWGEGWGVGGYGCYVERIRRSVNRFGDRCRSANDGHDDEIGGDERDAGE
jgi:Papain family cysteine protease